MNKFNWKRYILKIEIIIIIIIIMLIGVMFYAN